MRMRKKNLPEKKKNFKSGDYVTFHTQYGQTCGIIDYIKPGTHGEFQKAVITVKYTVYSTKKYERELFKLRHI